MGKYEQIKEIFLEFDITNSSLPGVLEINNVFIRIASFINDLFNRLPVAFILTMKTYICDFFIVLEKLTSPKIKVLKYSNIYIRKMYDQLDYNVPNGVIDKLENLEEFHLLPGEWHPTISSCYTKAYEAFLCQLTQRRNVVVKVCERINSEILVPHFTQFQKLTQKYRINIHLSFGTMLENSLLSMYIQKNDERKEFRVENLVSLDISIDDLIEFKRFSYALPLFNNLKKLNLEFSEYFLIELNQTTDNKKNIFINYLKPMILQNIEAFKLFIENRSLPYDTNDDFLQSFIFKEEVTKQLISYFGDKLKVINLFNIPNMNQELGDTLSEKCPNITNMYLAPYSSISLNFIEKMKKLKFIKLRGTLELIIPSNVEMVVTTGVDYQGEIQKFLATADDNEVYEFFKNNFNKEFKYSIRNCKGGFFKDHIFFNNIFHWPVYSEKMNYW
uniref:FTH domain-containing protein n=1 Tax=Parastrongyloides trichosuri TaxID=131310 RepID=A0A0N4ZDC6_PARTI